MANEFVKAFKGIDKAIQQGTTRALNKALSNAKTQLVKRLGEETSLKASVIKTRVLGINAKANKQSVQIAIAVKVGIPLAEFSPSPKVVKVVHEGHTSPTRHVGATVRIKGSRELVPGGFIWLDPGGKARVIARKDQNNNRSKLVQIRTNVFSEAAAKQASEATASLQAKFLELISTQIDYAIQSKFDSDK